MAVIRLPIRTAWSKPLLSTRVIIESLAGKRICFEFLQSDAQACQSEMLNSKDDELSSYVVNLAKI